MISPKNSFQNCRVGLFTKYYISCENIEIDTFEFLMIMHHLKNFYIVGKNWENLPGCKSCVATKNRPLSEEKRTSMPEEALGIR